MSIVCSRLHKLFNRMNRFSFPITDNIPQNGIYILFEKGETAHGCDRIVRVGTHTGINQLRSRLLQHFVMENKDRSIFRKNIGRAILAKNHDSFAENWELDLTERKQKEMHRQSINFTYQKQIEKKVSAYIQNNFSFIVFEVAQKEKRLELESKIISAISFCDECHPSSRWLGLFSPKQKIRDSGLWLVNELHKTPLSEQELVELENLIEKQFPRNFAPTIS